MIRIAQLFLRALALPVALAVLLLPTAALGQQDELLGGVAPGEQGLGQPRLAQGNILRVAISMGGDTSVSEVMHLSLGKSAIVELPIDVSDALVSNPAIADAIIRTPRRIYVLGLAVGQTNAFFFDGQGQQILNLEIRVERDLQPVRDMIERLIPNARIEVEALNDNIVLSGLVSSAAESERAQQIAARYVETPEQVLNTLAITGGEQVLLKVRIVEMQRTLVKQLGINLGGTQNFTEVLDANGNVIGYDGSYTIDTDNEFALAGRALGGLTAGVELGNTVNGVVQSSLEGTLSALERVGLVRTLAEPNLTAISGEAANFLAGGEFPIPSGRDSEGNVLVEYKPFGVGLSFTPVVIDDGRISLFVSTEVSELTDQGSLELSGGHIVDSDTGAVTTVPGVTLPGLKVRRAETTLELPSGGSMVMAGLIQDQTSQNIDGTPGAKDVPGLGALFRARDMRAEETELVVIVTPYLVSPTGQDQLSTPADGFRVADDLTSVFLGRLNRVYAAPDAQVEGMGWRGPIGFILDEGDSMPGRAGEPAPADGAQQQASIEISSGGE
jgi:pilus assembly protein CpaC